MSANTFDPEGRYFDPDGFTYADVALKLSTLSDEDFVTFLEDMARRIRSNVQDNLDAYGSWTLPWLAAVVAQEPSAGMRYWVVSEVARLRKEQGR